MPQPYLTRGICHVINSIRHLGGYVMESDFQSGFKIKQWFATSRNPRSFLKSHKN